MRTPKLHQLLQRFVKVKESEVRPASSLQIQHANLVQKLKLWGNVQVPSLLSGFGALGCVSMLDRFVSAVHCVYDTSFKLCCL